MCEYNYDKKYFLKKQFIYRIGTVLHSTQKETIFTDKFIGIRRIKLRHPRNNITHYVPVPFVVKINDEKHHLELILRYV